MARNSFAGRRLGAVVMPGAVSLAMVIGTLAMTWSPSPAVAAPLVDVNGCFTHTMQSPHVSAGAHGVISKASWQCSKVPSTIYLEAPSQGYYLWVCASSPPNDEEWIVNNCTPKGATYNNMNFTVANTDIFRYVPPTNQNGASGSGYWIACATWYSTGPGGTGGLRTVFSNVVRITYP